MSHKLKQHEQAILKIARHLFSLDPLSLIETYRNITTKRLSSNGKLYTAKHLKELYGIASRFALKQPFEPIPFCKSDKQGFPSEISEFKGWLQGNTHQKRIALTILYQYRLIRVEPDLNIDSIISDSKYDKGSWSRFEKDWETFISQWKIPQVQIKKTDIHLTSKAGPNGPRALSLAHVDAKAVLNSPLLGWIDKWCSLKQNEYLKDIPSDIRGFAPFSHIDNPRTSRLHFISEGGAKTRVIAICDYWSQVTLKTLHNYIMKTLRSLTTDGTYSHNRIADLVKDRSSRGVPIWCFDLSSATDRFPVEIQERVLKSRIGNPAARIWKNLMVDRDFYHPKIGSNIRYKVGQPMGILSSWAVFSLSHHAIIQFCGYLEGFKSFREYTIIGDDVAIFSEPVAERYKEIITILGVEINLKKSIISKQEPISAEIAKRIFLQGDELSPIPPDVIKASCKDYRVIPQLIKIMSDRGWFDIIEFIPDSESFFNKRVTPWLREWYPSKSEELLDFVTSPFFLPPLFKGSGERWKNYSEEEILWTAQLVLNDMLISKSIESMEAHVVDYPLYGAKPFDDWGVLPDTSALGSLAKRHPLIRAYYQSFTELRSFVSLSRDQYATRLEGVIREVSHVIDPSISHYWSTERKKYIFHNRLQAKLIEALEHRVYFEVGPGTEL